MSDTRLCPYCGEQIKSIAIKCKHCGEFFDQAPARSGDFSFPTEVGAYRILGIMGEGAMGTVFRARHRSESMATRQGGDVCVKTMHPQYARDSQYQARFEREASLGMELDHPGIVMVHDLINDSGALALVMELVQGRSLSDLIGRETGPIPWARAWPLFSQLLEAVAHAHEHGVIHRDLKPDNVMVTPGERLKVLDFGIAREAGSGATRTGIGMGTADYMAPEQHTDARAVDQRADIYALGMTLYEMLAGRLPWDDGLDMLGVLQRKQKMEIPPPTAFYPDIPQAVVRVVLSTLAPEREARPARVTDLYRALAALDEFDPTLEPLALVEKSSAAPVDMRRTTPGPLAAQESAPKDMRRVPVDMRGTPQGPHSPPTNRQVPVAAPPAPAGITIPWLWIGLAVVGVIVVVGAVMVMVLSKEPPPVEPDQVLVDRDEETRVATAASPDQGMRMKVEGEACKMTMECSQTGTARLVCFHGKCRKQRFFLASCDNDQPEITLDQTETCEGDPCCDEDKTKQKAILKRYALYVGRDIQVACPNRKKKWSKIKGITCRTDSMAPSSIHASIGPCQAKKAATCVASNGSMGAEVRPLRRPVMTLASAVVRSRLLKTISVRKITQKTIEEPLENKLSDAQIRAALKTAEVTVLKVKHRKASMIAQVVMTGFESYMGLSKITVVALVARDGSLVELWEGGFGGDRLLGVGDLDGDGFDEVLVNGYGDGVKSWNGCFLLFQSRSGKREALYCQYSAA